MAGTPFAPPLGHPIRPPGMEPMMPPGNYGSMRSGASSGASSVPPAVVQSTSTHAVPPAAHVSTSYRAIPPPSSAMRAAPYPPRNERFGVPAVADVDPTYTCLLCCKCGAVRVGPISLRPWWHPAAGSYHSYRVVKIGCEPHLSDPA